MTTQLALWEPEPCDTGPAPGRWIHISRVSDEERAFLDRHGEDIPRTTITIHTPELCCDRDRFH